MSFFKKMDSHRVKADRASAGAAMPAGSGKTPAPALRASQTPLGAPPGLGARVSAAKKTDSTVSAARPRSPSTQVCIAQPLSQNTVHTHAVFSGSQWNADTKSRLKNQFQLFFAHANPGVHTDIGLALGYLLQDPVAVSAWADMASSHMPERFAGAAVLLQDPRREHTERLLTQVKDFQPIFDVSDQERMPSGLNPPIQDGVLRAYNQFIHIIKCVRAMGLPAHALKDSAQENQTPKVMAMLSHYCTPDSGVGMFHQAMSGFFKSPEATQALAGLFSNTAVVRQAAGRQLSQLKVTADVIFSLMTRPELQIDNLQDQTDLHAKIMQLVLEAKALPASRADAKTGTQIDAKKDAAVRAELEVIESKIAQGYGKSTLQAPEKKPSLAKFKGVVTLGELFGLGESYVQSLMGPDFEKDSSHHLKYPKENIPQTSAELYQMVAARLF
jgi:hypothetical protein